MNTILNPRTKTFFVYLFLFLLITHTIGCYYYKVQNIPSSDTSAFFQATTFTDYFIVHQENGDDVTLTNIYVDSTRMLANVKPVEQSVYYSQQREGARYRKGEKSIVHEVHVYLAEASPKLTPAEGVQVTIPYRDIKQIDVIDADTGKTVSSHFFTTVGVTLGVLTVFLIIALLTKSSCPYVYVHDGEGFVFQGEIFGGAIMQNMERDDYLPLPLLKAVDGEYQVRITNELKERQYTDLAELLVVNHAPQQQALIDQQGTPYITERPSAPLTAQSLAGQTINAALAAKDRQVFSFDETDYAVNALELTFEKPLQTKQAQLVLNAQNSLWLDFLYGEFAQKLGGKYEKWMAERAEISGEERWTKLLENHVPLSIYLEQDGVWQVVEHLPTAGPLAARDFVIPLDLTKHTAEYVRIKIETGFKFWELDYAALNYTTTTAVDIQNIALNSAMGTGGIDWSEALQRTDQLYMEQLQIGDVTQLHFTAPEPPPGQIQSVFLHTRGYYELIRDFSGSPKLKELKRFKEPGYFAEFSRIEYQKKVQALLEPALTHED